MWIFFQGPASMDDSFFTIWISALTYWHRVDFAAIILLLRNCGQVKLFWHSTKLTAEDGNNRRGEGGEGGSNATAGRSRRSSRKKADTREAILVARSTRIFDSLCRQEPHWHHTSNMRGVFTMLWTVWCVVIISQRTVSNTLVGELANLKHHTGTEGLG